jgi:hypothetical protein
MLFDFLKKLSDNTNLKKNIRAESFFFFFYQKIKEHPEFELKNKKSSNSKK